jgi:phage terminase small subunit
VNDRQRRFIIEYVIDFNGYQAAIRAGYSPISAHDQAFKLLSNLEIMEAIDERLREVASAKALSAEWVLDQWRQIAIADPAELIYVQIECCRFCFGLNNNYQWTEFEYREIVRAAQEHVCNSKCEQPCGKKCPPLALGGFGFTPHKTPNPDCPLCHGAGHERVVVTDTRSVRGPARRLYAGVQKTKDGIKIMMRDQDKALDNIARYFGMLIDKKEISLPGITSDTISADDLTDDQLAQIIDSRVDLLPPPVILAK